MQSRTLASRAARWSAGHRKTTIFGWLAFVIISVFIAGAVGQQTIADEDYGNGEVKAADKAIAAADFRDAAEEQVLVQGKGSVKIGDPAFTAAVDDTVSRLEATKGVDKVESPLAEGNKGQLSEDGRSALVTFEIPGDDEVTEERVDGALAATAAAQKANPQVFVGQFGDASADKAISKAFEEDFQKAEVLCSRSAAAHPHRRVRPLVAMRRAAAARRHGRGRHHRPARADQPAVPDGRVGRLGRAARGPGRRRRLLDVLSPAQDGGARRRAARRGRARVRGGDVGPGRAHLRPDRDDRDGRHVLRREHRVQSFAIGTILVVGIAVLGSLTVLPAVLSSSATRSRRAACRSSGACATATTASPVWGWILDRVLRRPVVSLVVAGGYPRRAQHPGARHADRQPGHLGLPRDLEVMKVYDRIQAAFPGGPIPALVAVQADDVTKPEVQAGIQAMNERARQRPDVRARHHQHEPGQDRRGRVDPDARQRHRRHVERRAGDAPRRRHPRDDRQVGGVEADVTGMTAGSKDFNDSMTATCRSCSPSCSAWRSSCCWSRSARSWCRSRRSS